MKDVMDISFSGRSPRRQGRRSELISLFLLMEKELSGYDIRRILDEWHINDYLPVSPAAIYRTLNRLAEDGLVNSFEEQRGNYPVSTVYRITEAGREAYKLRLEQEASFHRTPFAAMAFISLASYVPVKERIQLVDGWIEKGQALVAQLRKRLDPENQDALVYGKPYAEWLLLDHEACLMEAEVTWMQKYKKLLLKGDA